MSRASFLTKPIEYSFIASVLLVSLPALDILFFHFFNGHLQWAPLLYNAFFAALNHNAERKLNVIIIFCSMLVGMPIKKSLLKHLSMIIAIALWYELFFQIIRYAEKYWLIPRVSPSLRLNLHVDLSQFDSNNLIHVYAKSSFPSGHAMILGYWYHLARTLYRRPWREISMGLSLFMCLPRLIAGAHWFSDVLAGFILGTLAFKVIDQFIKKEDLRAKT